MQRPYGVRIPRNRSHVGPEDRVVIPVVLDQPILGAEPHKALAVLEDAADDVIGQTLQRKPFETQRLILSMQPPRREQAPQHEQHPACREEANSVS